MIAPSLNAPVVELNVNGILTFPSDADGWTDRAVTLAHLHLNRHAEKIENFTGVFTRMLRQQRKAELLAKVANKYLEAGWRVVMRGHSNGCDIIRRALGLVIRPVDCVQFIAPATEADFNGCDRKVCRSLNWLMQTSVHRLVICGSRNDWALKGARLSSPVLNLMGNRYGTLGLRGPVNVAPRVAPRVHLFWNDEFGHSDWLTPARLLNTMKLASNSIASEHTAE